jgi:hypothetical protein
LIAYRDGRNKAGMSVVAQSAFTNPSCARRLFGQNNHAFHFILPCGVSACRQMATD